MDLTAETGDLEHLLGDATEETCPPDLVAPDLVFDAAFHPTEMIFSTGLVNGDVVAYQYRQTETRLLTTLKVHSGGITGMEFSEQGTHLVTASSDRSISVMDCQAQRVVIHIPKSAGKGGPNPHKVGISSLNICTNDIVATGDDDGLVAIWDMRQRKPAFKYHEHGDFVSQLLYFSEVNQLVTSSGDTCVGCYDMRKGDVLDFSETRKDELTCMAFIGATNDLICGTPTGLLPVWKFGSWARPFDTHKDHPKECDSIVPFNDNIFFTGACDGMIRVIQHYPARRVLCHLGGHDRRRIGVSKIRISGDRKMLLATGADRLVQFFDISFMHSDGELDKLRSRADQRYMATLRAANAEQDKMKAAAAAAEAEEGEESDDDDDSDWTSDSDDSDDDDDDSDAGGSEVAVEDDEEEEPVRKVAKRKPAAAAAATAEPNVLDQPDEQLTRTTKRERVAAAKWLKEAQTERINYRKERSKRRTQGFFGDLTK